MFSIDFDRIIRRTLPFFLRSPLTLKFLGVFGAVLKGLNDNFVLFTEAIDFKLRWNNQVMYLEKYLNTVYDPVLQRIFITNVDNPSVFLHLKSEPVAKLFIFQKSEGKQPIFLRTATEFEGEIDYIVNIPNSITFDLTVITAQIKVYNVAGTRFEIQTF